MHQEDAAPIALVPGKSDIERAREYRDEIIKAVQPVMEVLSRARREGFNVTIGWQLNGFGQVQLNQCEIVKILKLD